MNRPEYVHAITNDLLYDMNLFEIKCSTSEIIELKKDYYIVFSMEAIDGELVILDIYTRLKKFIVRFYEVEMINLSYDKIIECLSIFKQQEYEKNTIISKIVKDSVKTVEDRKLEIRYKDSDKPITNSRHLTAEIINDRFKDVKLCLAEEYTGRPEEKQVWNCLNILNHTFECSYKHAKREYLDNRKGCPYCSKQQILDKIKWHSYKDKSYELEEEYDSWEDLKEKNTNLSKDEIKIIKNIVREERWLTPVAGRVYSIISPNDEGKLDLNKPLSNYEKFIIQILGINFNMMKQRIFKTKFNFVIAIDEKNGKAYVCDSMTKLSNAITYVDSNQRLNRKTISKYVDAGKDYAGYIFRTCDMNLIEEYKEKYEVQTI